jgi:hypothetical protein
VIDSQSLRLTSDDLLYDVIGKGNREFFKLLEFAKCECLSTGTMRALSTFFAASRRGRRGLALNGNTRALPAKVKKGKCYMA